MKDAIENQTAREVAAVERDFETSFQAFVERAQAMLDTHRAKECPNGLRRVLEVMPGDRYVRVVATERSEGKTITRSAYCFVEIATGDVLKPDGWKRPAKGVRGNIYAENPIAGVTPYGAAYLARR